MHNLEEYNRKVYSFKNNWCNENSIIPILLREKLGKYLDEPILDVGAGMGDIANQAFPDKKAFCIDLVLPKNKQILNNPNHQWIKVNFFDFEPPQEIKTLLISHTQQFLDENIQKFIKKIKQLDPFRVILVSNVNDGVLGQIVNWTLDNYPESNPEVPIKYIDGYVVKETAPFTAHLACDTFETLADQISYLMVNNTPDFKTKVCLQLPGMLSKPLIPISEIIEVYERNN